MFAVADNTEVVVVVEVVEIAEIGKVVDVAIMVYAVVVVQSRNEL